jgi:hypothetical protein
MSESIQAPKKRTYTRKPKVVALSDVLSSDSEKSTTSTDSELSLTPPEPVPQKPKRQYKKKVTIEPVEPVDEIPPPPILERQTNNIEESPPELVKEKKPRSDKQKEAFEKMRLARIAKQEELKKLKEVEREQKLLEKEQTKLNNITEKVVEKATAIKQRKSKKTTETFDDLPQEPQYQPIIQETKPKQIVFV